MPGEQIVVLVLLLLLGATAVGIARQHNLLAVAMLTGIFSLLGASWMLLLDAPDVAITEAAVGAGVSTILILATLAATTTRERSDSPTSWLGLAVVTVTGGVLVYGTFDMPGYGDPNAPAYASPVTAAYLASATPPPEHGDRHGDAAFAHSDREPPGLEAFHVGIPNTVTTVLASFRGYDTMGETTVVLTAGLGVVAILAGSRRRRPVEPDALDALDDEAEREAEATEPGDPPDPEARP